MYTCYHCISVSIIRLIDWFLFVAPASMVKFFKGMVFMERQAVEPADERKERTSAMVLNSRWTVTVKLGSPK
jgi:hypothetical protein